MLGRKLWRVLFPTSVLIFIYGLYIVSTKMERERSKKLTFGLTVSQKISLQETGKRKQTAQYSPVNISSVLAVSHMAVAQVPNGILMMIREIERRHETLKGAVTPIQMVEPTCGPKGSPINGVQDLLCMTPPTFLPNYKNPCWIGARDRFKCLPYFQIIGMDKSGSTDLFDRIAMHPDVLPNNGTMGKETMWWSWKRYGHWLKHDLQVKENFERYTRYFKNAALQILASNSSTGLVTGDGTPMDIWDMSGWVSIPQNNPPDPPTYLTPHLIKHVNPNVKLLVILRDPVERLFSDYFFLGLGKMSSQAFHTNLLKSVEILRDCTRKMSLRLCLFQREFHIKVPVRIHLGFYSIFLREWLKVFPRDQFYILRTEDYSENMHTELENMFRFLQLRELSKTSMTKIVKAAKKYVGKRKKKAKMLPESKAVIEQLYQKFNSELAVLLNDQRYTWPKNRTIKSPLRSLNNL